MDFNERTDEEILERIAHYENTMGDFFGTMRGDLIAFLPFDKAKRWLKDEATRDDWKQDDRSLAGVTLLIRDYLSFAWDKANNCRGLSAGRSIDHMKVWLWMLREEDAAKAIDDYSLYGKPQLRAISEAVGFDWRKHDNNEWTNSESDEGIIADAVPSITFPLSRVLLPEAA